MGVLLYRMLVPEGSPLPMFEYRGASAGTSRTKGFGFASFLAGAGGAAGAGLERETGGGAKHARLSGMGRGAESLSAVWARDGWGLISPRGEASPRGMMREGVKGLLAERGSRFWGDSEKPAWVMPSLASSSLSLEPPRLGLVPKAPRSASLKLSDLRMGEGGKYCWERVR
jgi:hypothetical protein